MKRFWIIATLLLLSYPMLAQSTAPKGWLAGHVEPMAHQPENAHIFLSDGTEIDPTNPGDAFVKLLERWRKHPSRTTFFYRLGARYNGLQDIEIEYMENWAGGRRWKGAFKLPPQ